MLRRTKEIEDKYQKFLKTISEDYCPFCKNLDKESIVLKFSNWIVVKNSFPYNIFEDEKVLDHLLFTPIRHVSCMEDLTWLEQNDFWHISEKLPNFIEYVLIRNKIKDQSVKGHLHFHLLKTK